MLSANSVSFRFSGKLARLLGEESVSNASVAVAELVKNSFDADASYCRVVFMMDSNQQLVLQIQDDGHGMTPADIQDKWMVVGTSDKEYNPISRGGRIKVGEKGIGRFAVQRLGHEVEIESRPQHTGEEIRLSIDWDAYTKANVTFDQVTHPMEVRASSDTSAHGLRLTITRLRDSWDKGMTENLRLQLAQLVPPSISEKNFRIELQATHVGISERSLEPQILQEYFYKMNFTFDGKGAGKYTTQLKGKEAVENSLKAGAATCGPFTLDLYAYVLGPGTRGKYSDYVLKGSQLRGQLEQFCGIKVYKDGFRVRPYGDPGNDWLGLNAMAYNETGAFPNSNVIGVIQVSKKTNPLVETTTREGMIQNQGYFDLMTVTKLAIRTLIAERNKAFPEIPRTKVSSSTVNQIVKAAEQIKSTARNDAASNKINDAVREIEKEVDKIESEQITKAAMYRGLSSLGISLAAVSHEIAEPIGVILQRTKRSLEVLKQRVTSPKENIEWWNQTEKEIKRINEFIGYVTVFSSASERTKALYDVKDAVEETFRAYNSIFLSEQVLIEKDIAPDLPQFYGFRTDLESILINFITNSLEAFREVESRREIKITCENEAGSLRITFSDSGSGIPPENRELIFNPFWTTKPNVGTGLGLTIVREIVTENNGSIAVIASEIGHGATFLVKIPFPEIKPG